MLNLLLILDGYGYSATASGNAIAKSGTPYLNSLLKKYPNTLIGASGLDVGLPEGQMGNSEVGHTNIGAGRVVYQELTRISKEIRTKEFFENKALLAAMRHAKENNKAFHAMGLLSDGGVHSHIEHLFALIDMAKEFGLKDIFIHCFMDGRDVAPTSGIEFVKKLQDYIDKVKFGTIASIIGRFYAMDRDNRWDRVQKAYSALVDGEGIKTLNAVEAVQQSYNNGITDEFILPTIVCEKGKCATRIAKNDSIVFFNFRPDRAREITRAFINENFDSFNRAAGYLNPYYVCFTQYDSTFTNVDIAFNPQTLTNNLGEIVAAHGLKQLRIAETEKYAHVTFFFNSGKEEANPLEDRVLIASPKVQTYDLKPEMSVYEVADEAAKLIKEDKYDLIILNFANCDMVGHTGVFDAAVKAVKAVDQGVKTVVEAALSVNANIIITADHGNAEKMFEEDGSAFTAHTTNPVPLILIKQGVYKLRERGKLCDIAPTILSMMNIEIPKEMTGETLIIQK